MKLHQLSLFLENRPGTIKIPVQALADAKINLLALCLADTSEFGILRLIVREWEKGKEILQKAGCVVNVTEVLALDVPDSPGGLASVLALLEHAHLEIEYMYAFTSGQRGKKAALIFRFENPDAAITLLAQHHINVITPIDLFARIEG
jgi:hypothetical protein